MDHTILLMDVDGYEYQVFFAWIWMDMDLLNFLSMDMDEYGFHKPHSCQSLLKRSLQRSCKTFTQLPSFYGIS